MATALLADPVRLDALNAHAANAARRCARTRKHYASAAGISPSRASAHRNGSDLHNPGLHFLVQLARNARTTAWPLIAEGIAVTNQAELTHLSVGQLRDLLAELTDTEHTLEAEENRATVNAATSTDPVVLEAAALADVREGEVSLRRAAVRRELALRYRRGDA